jgi:hypothetical protein
MPYNNISKSNHALHTVRLCIRKRQQQLIYVQRLIQLPTGGGHFEFEGSDLKMGSLKNIELGLLNWILEIGWDGMDWIELAQDKDQWRALVNMVMNLRVP